MTLFIVNSKPNSRHQTSFDVFFFFFSAFIVRCEGMVRLPNINNRCHAMSGHAEQLRLRRIKGETSVFQKVTFWTEKSHFFDKHVISGGEVFETLLIVDLCCLDDCRRSHNFLKKILI